MFDDYNYTIEEILDGISEKELNRFKYMADTGRYSCRGCGRIDTVLSCDILHIQTFGQQMAEGFLRGVLGNSQRDQCICLYCGSRWVT
jgi:hypothetical protein